MQNCKLYYVCERGLPHLSLGKAGRIAMQNRFNIPKNIFNIFKINYISV